MKLTLSLALSFVASVCPSFSLPVAAAAEAPASTAAPAAPVSGDISVDLPGGLSFDVSVGAGMAPNAFVDAANRGFEATAPSGAALSPSCLRKGGVELLILDPGHDDSDASMRSDAKVRGQSGSRTQFLWPAVHEGHLTQATAWLVYDLMLKDPRLSDAERAELATMVRFTRHPGEKTFGQYEKELGYASSTQGLIDAGVTNRPGRMTYMMQHHRAYDATSAKHWSSSTQDVSSKTVMISVHANSTDYFNEGDLTWVIPPKGTSSTSATTRLQHGVVQGLAAGFGDFYDSFTGDATSVVDLKKGVLPSVAFGKIQTEQHWENLAVLSPTIGTSSTRKLLIEGFVMNGKAGNLANRELTATGGGPAIVFTHGGKSVGSYGVSGVYLAYARSIVLGLNSALGCGN